MPDDATVEILIKARNTAEAQIAEAQGGLDLLRRAVEAVSRAQLEGLSGAEAYRKGLKSIRDNAIEAGLGSEALKVATNQARTALQAYFAAIAGGLPIEAAQSAALAEVSGQFIATAAAADVANVAEGNFFTNRLAGYANITKNLPKTIFGPVLSGIGGFLAPIAGIAAILSPLSAFIAALAAAVVIMTAFSVGAAGMALALAGATGMFLTIGGALVLLTDKMGWINNSMGIFKQHLKEVGAHLAQLAAPAANTIMKFLDSLLPLAQSAGRDIIEWFSSRLPLALTSMHSAINNLAPDIKSFAQFLGAMFDKITPSIAPMFEEVARFGIGALQGLIGNLVNLGLWFQQRLPTYGPVVSQIFGGIGNAVQGLATNFGRLSDWFVKNWPSIKGNLDAFTGGFKDGFDAINKAFGGAGSVDWKGFFHGLGVALGGAAGAISDFARAFGIVFSQLVSALPAALKTIGDNWAYFVIGVVADINALINAYNSLPGILRGGGQTIPLITGPLPPGTAPQDLGGGNGRGGLGAPPARRTAPNVTIHVSGATSPQVTSSTIARNLRKIGVV